MQVSIGVSWAVTLLIAAIAVAYATITPVPAETLIVITNGIYAGTLCAVIVAFWPLIIDIIFNRNVRLERWRVMALGVFGLHVAYALSCMTSVMYRAYGIEVPPSYFTGVHRIIATVSAVAMVTAPDLGYGFFYGRDRKTLWGAILVGVILAVVVIFLQDTAAFAFGF